MKGKFSEVTRSNGSEPLSAGGRFEPIWVRLSSFLSGSAKWRTIEIFKSDLDIHQFGLRSASGYRRFLESLPGTGSLDFLRGLMLPELPDVLW